MAKVAKQTNWFAVWITGFVVLFIVGIVAVTFITNKNMEAEAQTPAVSPASASINSETGAIVLGDGPNVVDEYLDFMCPHCGDFFAAYSPTLSDSIADGSITLNVHPIGILNNSSMGTEYSTRSANAAYCVAEENPDAAYPFIDLLFKNRPAQGTEGLNDEKLIEFASTAGAPNAASCINDGKFKSFVEEMTEKTPIIPGQAGIATPTVLVNGEFINVAGDPETELVARLTK